MALEKYKEMTKKDLKKAVETQQLPLEQYMAFIDMALKDLTIVDDSNINNNITNFYNTIDNLSNQIIELNKKIYEEYKTIYEQLMKDL